MLKRDWRSLAGSVFAVGALPRDRPREEYGSDPRQLASDLGRLRSVTMTASVRAHLIYIIGPQTIYAASHNFRAPRPTHHVARLSRT
jgi:hypothetical protein